MPDSDEVPFHERVVQVHQDKGKALLRLARRNLAAEGLPASCTDAEDIVQDALVVVLTNGPGKEIESIYSYLCAVVRNRVKDVSRRKSASPLDTTHQAAEGHKALWVSDVEDDIDARLDAEHTLQKMSPQQRRLILLSKGMGYTQAELSQITGLHRGSIATHIRRATAAFAAAVAVAVTVFTIWGQEITARLHWIDTASDGRLRDILAPSSPTFAIGLASVSGAFAFWYRQYQRDRDRRGPKIARDTHVLLAMLEVSPELQRGKSVPTPSDYAARLGIPEAWITLDALRHGRLHVPPGTKRPLHCQFDAQLVNGIVVGRGDNEIVSGTVTHFPSRYTDPPTSERGYVPGAEGAP